jgi:hypothetical protein
VSLQKFKALQEFRSKWQKLDEGDVGRTGRLRVFAKIYYSSPKGIENDRAYVTISFDGYEQGQIDIDETADLTVSDFHLRFSPDWQDYIFDTDNDTLVIEGNSPKMGGEYMVRIHPTER